jgi:hypothetical protein
VSGLQKINPLVIENVGQMSSVCARSFLKETIAAIAVRKYYNTSIFLHFIDDFLDINRRGRKYSIRVRPIIDSKLHQERVNACGKSFLFVQRTWKEQKHVDSLAIDFNAREDLKPRFF